MATGRREFLKLAAGVCLTGGCPARDVVFCRVSESTMAEAVDWLRSVFDGAMPVSSSETTLRYRGFVAEYRQSGERELVVCGSCATLVLDSSGHRRFA